MRVTHVRKETLGASHWRPWRPVEASEGREGLLLRHKVQAAAPMELSAVHITQQQDWRSNPSWRTQGHEGEQDKSSSTG